MLGILLQDIFLAEKDFPTHLPEEVLIGSKISRHRIGIPENQTFLVIRKI